MLTNASYCIEKWCRGESLGLKGFKLEQGEKNCAVE
jgi:hypothetical protein